MDRHQRVHDGLKPHDCPHCELKFAQRCSMKRHVRVVHLGDKQFKCSYCGLSFGTSSGMKSHVVSRHNDKEYARFQCNVCWKRFYSGNSYRDHMAHKHRRLDPKEEMIKRGECFYPGCGKVYSSGTNPAERVRYHLVAVHRDRDYAHYECIECDKLYYERTSYRGHMKSQHGVIMKPKRPKSHHKKSEDE